MREPRCNNIVPTKNLWEIAIEFLGKIDNNLIEFNLKLAYIMLKLCKIEKIPYSITSKLVFLSCFNDVGKLYELENKSDSTIETYLFLKYFSPVKDYTAILLDEKKFILSIPNIKGLIFKSCKDYTSYLLETNDKNEAMNYILDNKKNYMSIDVKALEILTKKNDLIYEFNSYHYKTVVYKYISKMMFSAKEKNKFIIMLSSLFEMYSSQTLYHSKVTAIIAYKLAKIMKLGNKRAKKLYIAGLCHDLGKVCIPLRILEKPDKLTDREFSTMKKHVTYTKEILNSKMDYEIIELAYRHHEKLDGSGYPNKLKADSITIDQRVLQVADIISALIAKRSYKEAWNIDMTIGILDDLVANNKLDKSVVEAFKNNQKKILKLTNDFTIQAEKTYERINKERENLKEKRNIATKAA